MRNNPLHIEQWYRNHATLTIYYGLRVLVACAGAFFIVRGDLETAIGTFLVLLVMSVPSIVKNRYRIYLPFALDLWIVTFIFLTFFMGNIADVYNEFPIWDKLLHFQSGLLLSATGYVLIYWLNEAEHDRIELTPVFVSLFAVVFSLALGAIWEMIEFAMDTFWSTEWQASNTDTMYDLMADGIGAVVFSTGAYFWMYRHKRLPFTPTILKLFEKAREVAQNIKSS